MFTGIGTLVVRTLVQSVVKDLAHDGYKVVKQMVKGSKPKSTETGSVV